MALLHMKSIIFTLTINIWPDFRFGSLFYLPEGVCRFGLVSENIKGEMISDVILDTHVIR